jgi:hypothetical protein
MHSFGGAPACACQGRPQHHTRRGEQLSAGQPHGSCMPTMVHKELLSTARSSGGHSPPPASWRPSHMSRSPPPEGPSQGWNSAGPGAIAHSICEVADTKAAWPSSELVPCRPTPACCPGSVICSRTAPSRQARPISLKALSTMRSSVADTASPMESHSATRGRCATRSCCDPCKRSQRF